MDSQIEFSPKAIYQIANVMATQNSADPNYMKGPELVSLFNTLGYLDAYTFLTDEESKLLTMEKACLD